MVLVVIKDGDTVLEKIPVMAFLTAMGLGSDISEVLNRFNSKMSQTNITAQLEIVNDELQN
jgi:hypothetical protein